VGLGLKRESPVTECQLPNLDVGGGLRRRFAFRIASPALVPPSRRDRAGSPAACGLLIYCSPFRRVHFPVPWQEGQAGT